jgi:hypothetical protein
MTLQELIDAAIQHQFIKETRIEPMRTAVTHYAAMLGVAPAECLPAAYDLAEPQLVTFVQAHAPADWTRRTLTNLYTHVQLLLRLGREQGWLEARGTHFNSWRNHRDGPKEGWVPRHELPPKLIYRLQAMPASLEQEIQSYLQWCQRVVQPGRPRSVKKRATTCKVVSEALTRMAGFAVHFQHLPAELLPCATSAIPRWSTSASSGGSKTDAANSRRACATWSSISRSSRAIGSRISRLPRRSRSC